MEQRRKQKELVGRAQLRISEDAFLEREASEYHNGRE